MIAPAELVRRFFLSGGVGILLGLFYDFLRPLRPRLTQLCDLIFVLSALLGWVYVSFGICLGQLHWGYTAGMILGGFLWEGTIGKHLHPVFHYLWKILGYPFHKISGFFRKKRKKLFAFLKKWVTIEWNKRCQKRQHSGGESLGKKAGKSRISQQACNHGHRFGRSHLRHHRRGVSAGRPGRKQESIRVDARASRRSGSRQPGTQ